MEQILLGAVDSGPLGNAAGLEGTLAAQNHWQATNRLPGPRGPDLGPQQSENERKWFGFATREADFLEDFFKPRRER